MRIFSATDAAHELEIDPRALRRFLRNDPTYRNVGMGGRYAFTESEVRSLKRAYAAHLRKNAGAAKPKKPAPVPPEPQPHLNSDKGVPLSALGPKGLTPSLRAQRREARALRQQRLLGRMGEVLEFRPDNVPVIDA